MLVNWRPTASIHLTQFSSRIKIASLITRPNKYTRNKSGCLQAAQLHTEGWNSTINGLRWNAYLWPASALTARIANAYLTRTQSRARSSRGESHLSRRMFASVYCVYTPSFFFLIFTLSCFYLPPYFSFPRRVNFHLRNNSSGLDELCIDGASWSNRNGALSSPVLASRFSTDIQVVFFSFSLSLINGSWK